MNADPEVHHETQANAIPAPPSFDDLCITRKKLLRAVEAKKAIRDRAQFEYDAAMEELAAIKHALSACIERDL